MFACIHSPGLEERTVLVGCAHAFSPLVEETAEDKVVLDIGGCELLFGSPREIAKEIARHAVALGLKVNVAVAQNPDAAIHAAKSFKGITVIPPGREGERLGRLPLAALDVSLAQVEADHAAQILETLESWGIRSFREFAALPATGIAERLGPEGLRLQSLARGGSDRPLLLSKPAPRFECALELDDPIELLEPLSFILGRLLKQLCAKLQEHSLAAGALKLRLRLEDKSEYERVIELPFPLRDGKVFLRLLLLDLQSHPPQSAIVAVSAACEPAAPRSIQKGFFQALAPEPEQLELTLARLTALVGEDNVGSPALTDTHRPNAFRMKRFVVKRNVAHRRRSSTEREHATGEMRSSKYFLGFRIFRPPLRAEVETPHGWPARIKARTAAGRSISGNVLNLAGPWRTTGGWWDEDYWARDEWDVAVADKQGAILYRIYYDLKSEGWFIEGIYD